MSGICWQRLQSHGNCSLIQLAWPQMADAEEGLRTVCGSDCHCVTTATTMYTIAFSLSWLVVVKLLQTCGVLLLRAVPFRSNKSPCLLPVAAKFPNQWRAGPILPVQRWRAGGLMQLINLIVTCLKKMLMCLQVLLNKSRWEKKKKTQQRTSLRTMTEQR